MSKQNRRQELAEQTRSQLVQEAHRQFSELGFMNVTVDDIALAMGMTKGALYHHFKNKRALFAAAYALQVENVVMAVSRAKSESLSPWQRIEAQCAAFFSAGFDSQKRQIPLQEAMTVLGRDEWLAIESRHTIGLVQSSVQNLMAARLIKRAPADMLASLIHSALTEAALYVSRAPDRRTAQASAQKAVMRMIRGL